MRLAVAASPGGIQISKAIDFRGAEKTNVHAALLEQRHNVEHLAGLRGATQIRRIAHRIQQLRRRCFSDQSIFVKSDSIGRVGLLGDEKCEDRQSHADEHQLTVCDFAGGCRDHQLTVGVAACGNLSFYRGWLDQVLPFFAADLR